MPQGAVPRRYAEAAFALAREKKNLDRWRVDLRVAAAILSDPKLLAQLDDPAKHMAENQKLIDGAMTVKIDPDVLHLIYLLTERGRSHSLQRIVDEFIEMADKEQGIVVADVITAVPLDEKRQQAVADRLKRLVGATQVQVRPHVDPRILGGIIAQVGDELYDGSVRTRLAQLAQRIS
jgi:F-type H+-transporting ATPase subunit delta